MNNRLLGRLLLAATLTVVVALFCANNMAKDNTPKTVKLPKYKNEDFYKDGKFQPEKAKEAYVKLMAAHGYPLSEFLRTNMWATDFGLGDFVNAGMGGIFWVNFQETGYFAHEIFLLPGQMIVEHAHVATAKGKAKMESWHVRNGSIYNVGEEGGQLPSAFKIPASQEKYVTVSKGYEMKVGDVRTLNRATAKHFMMGGPEGAIVSEYASFHDGDGLRFTNPGVKF